MSIMLSPWKMYEMFIDANYTCGHICNVNKPFHNDYIALKTSISFFKFEQNIRFNN